MLKHFSSHSNSNESNTESINYLVSTSYDKMLNVFKLNRSNPSDIQLIYKYEMPTLITDMIPFNH